MSVVRVSTGGTSVCGECVYRDLWACCVTVDQWVLPNEVLGQDGVAGRAVDGFGSGMV